MDIFTALDAGERLVMPMSNTLKSLVSKDIVMISPVTITTYERTEEGNAVLNSGKTPEHELILQLLAGPITPVPNNDAVRQLVSRGLAEVNGNILTLDSEKSSLAIELEVYYIKRLAQNKQCPYMLARKWLVGRKITMFKVEKGINYGKNCHSVSYIGA